MTAPISQWRRALLPGVALLAFAALGGSAVAQVTAAQQGAIRSNCRSDFMSKCSGVTPGGKDALACLQKNVQSLSPGCKTAVNATLPPPAPAAAAPAPAKPVQAAPAPAPSPAPATAAAPPPPAPAVTAKPATPAVVSAPPPRAKVAAPPRRAPATAAVAAPVAPRAPAPAAAPAPPTAAQQSAMKASCRSDFMAKCSGVTPGGKDALACLQRNVTTLSAACKKVVSSTMAAPPAGATATPVAVAPAATPEPKAGGFVPGGLVISKACARYILMHCRGMGLDMGRKVACLVDYANSGNFVGPRCKAALKISGHLR